MEIQALLTVAATVIFLLLVLVGAVVSLTRAFFEDRKAKEEEGLEEGETLEEREKKAEEVFMDTPIAVGRVKGHVKDLQIQWLKLNGRTYKTYEQLTASETLTPYELKEFEHILRFMNSSYSVVEEKQLNKREPFIKFQPRNFNEKGHNAIYIYNIGHFDLSKRVEVVTNCTKDGDVFIETIYVAENDVHKDMIYEAYRVGNPDGSDNLDEWNLYQQDVETYKGLFEKECAAVQEIRERVEIYNKYRHRIVPKKDGRFEFRPEVKKPAPKPVPKATPVQVPAQPSNTVVPPSDGPSEDAIDYTAF